MTTTLADPPTERSATSNSSSGSNQRSGGRRLRHEMTAVRLSFHWPGVRRALTPGQKATAADAFGAAGKFMTAGKKLVDTSHPKWKACTAVRSQCQKF